MGGSGHTDSDGALTINDPDNKFETLYDMVQFALSKDCQAPASLMYDFVDEMRKQKQFKTTMGKNRSAQFKTHPSHIIHCPDTYTNDEFDAVMWNYQGIKLCSSNIAPDDYKKVYASSAKRPIYAQRIACLY